MDSFVSLIKNGADEHYNKYINEQTVAVLDRLEEVSACSVFIFGNSLRSLQH